MAAYKILFDMEVKKDLTKLPKKISGNILKKVLALEYQPRPPQSLKLSGTEGIYRLRVGDYRVIYSINDPLKEVIVYHIRNRKEAYRDF